MEIYSRPFLENYINPNWVKKEKWAGEYYLFNLHKTVLNILSWLGS